ncbi:MAG: aminobenzoyl-glutamate transporter, partial [Marinilabiliales bacterium]
AANYYFMFASTFFIALIGTWVTEKIVIPRLGIYDGDEIPEKLEKLTKPEKRGMRFSLIAGVVLTVIILWGIIPFDGFLRGENGDVLHSPFLTGIVAIIFIGASILGIAYGIGARTYKSDNDVMKGMGKAMETLGIYIVLTFFAAQFVAYFRWTNIGLIFAIKAAGFIQSLHLGSIPLMIAFIILVGILNLFMGSASAKWAILAPAFIPMFMILGYSPELVQNTYRIGDSVTNIISPMMSYFALIVAFFQRYDKKSGIGTIIATMLPYTFFFFIVWVIILVVWLMLGWPVGPDSGLYYP